MEHSDANSIASVTKSYISALTGIAIRERVIPGINAKLMDYFPEIDWESLDPRKMEITIQQMLQMRTGYPWEEREGYYNTVWERRNDLIPLLAEFPLTSNPGTTWGYSNMTSHFLGIIIARAYSDSILSFGNKYLFGPLRVIVKAWPRDSHDYYFGSGDIFFTPREMARFGLLYLNKGVYKGLQLIPTKWIEESLTPYSFDILAPATIKGIQNLHYGYQWYCGTSGTHDYHFAWGQGGNFIFILQDLNMVITVTADSTQRAWEKTRVIFEMMGEFISKL
jgi:CubicO group peptidase (beta-lactamase class C family)